MRTQLEIITSLQWETRDFKQLTTTTPKWTTGSEDAQFAPTAHAIDETSVVVHLWTTVDTWVSGRRVKVSIYSTIFFFPEPIKEVQSHVSVFGSFL